MAENAPRSVDDLLSFYGMDGDEDEDEEEDEDYDPGGESTDREWMCVNCTMPNQEPLIVCQLCAEHRESGILRRGYLARPDVPAVPVEEPTPHQKSELSEATATGDQTTRQDAAGSVHEGSKSAHSRPNSEESDLPPGSILNSAGAATTAQDRLRGRTAVGFDPCMLLHEETGKAHSHPERPDRLRAIMGALEGEGLVPGRCAVWQSRPITEGELLSVHSPQHIAMVNETKSAVESSDQLAICYFTPDTYANGHSATSAQHAAGTCADMAAAIASGRIKNGAAMIRPPGHHAEHHAIMGFCLHNNAAVAARAAQREGAKRVLIVDWDVHHGNGTQQIFEDDPSVLYVSLHRYEGGRFYPGTGAPSEVGSGPGCGFSVNIGWPCGGVGDRDYLAAFWHVIMPLAYQFQPELIIVSAGFDAAAGDPLGGCKVSPACYAHMTSLLSTVAGGKLLVILEGGYNLRSISASTSAVIKVLLGDPPPPLPSTPPLGQDQKMGEGSSAAPGLRASSSAAAAATTATPSDATSTATVNSSAAVANGPARSGISEPAVPSAALPVTGVDLFHESHARAGLGERDTVEVESPRQPGQGPTESQDAAAPQQQPAGLDGPTAAGLAAIARTCLELRPYWSSLVLPLLTAPAAGEAAAVAVAGGDEMEEESEEEDDEEDEEDEEEEMLVEGGGEGAAGGRILPLGREGKVGSGAIFGIDQMGAVLGNHGDLALGAGASGGWEKLEDSAGGFPWPRPPSPHLLSSLDPSSSLLPHHHHFLPLSSPSHHHPLLLPLPSPSHSLLLPLTSPESLADKDERANEMDVGAPSWHEEGMDTGYTDEQELEERGEDQEGDSKPRQSRQLHPD